MKTLGTYDPRLTGITVRLKGSMAVYTLTGYRQVERNRVQLEHPNGTVWARGQSLVRVEVEKLTS